MVEQRERGVVSRFFSFLGRLIRGYFIAVGVAFTFLIIYAVSLLAWVGREPPSESQTMPSGSRHELKIELSGPVSESAPDLADHLMAEFSGDDLGIYLPDLRSQLQRAAVDDRVTSLRISLGSLRARRAQIVEIRRMLAQFKESGKEISISVSNAVDWNYFLATIADEIVLNPTSPVIIPGPSFTLVYFSQALKKLGFEVDVMRAGKYKSAFEPFVAQEPSAETLEQYRSMESSLRSYMIGEIADARSTPRSEVARWLKRGVFTAEEALTLGLVDKVGYPDPASVGSIDLSSYERDRGDSREVVLDQGGIALIEAVGDIRMSAPARDEAITPTSLKKQIMWAMGNDDVKAVVLRISSPGGSATASDIIWRDLSFLAIAKPLFVSMGAVAASGGYYIAAPAEKIFAETTTITGSIGVIGVDLSCARCSSEYGISFFTVSDTDRTNLLNPAARPTDEDRRLIESTIDQVYETFLRRVAAGRKMERDQVHALAQGRVYTGIEAKQIGLVDELGGLYQALQAAKEKVGFDSQKLYPVLRYRGERQRLFECLRDPGRCLDVGDSIFPEVGRLVGIGHGGLQRAKSWLSWMRQEPILALWPGMVALQGL